MPMYLVSFDTSSVWLCVAVSDGAHVLGAYCRRQPRGHGTNLVPVIARLLKRCGIAPRNVCGVGVVNGPGSFTGVRIGVATAKGLAVGLDIPVAQFSSLDVLAEQVKHRAPVIVSMIDARRQQVYAAVYRVNAHQTCVRRGPFMLATPAEVLSRIPRGAALVGDGVALLSEETRRLIPDELFLPDTFTRPQPRVLASMAADAYRRGITCSAAAVRAIYLYQHTCVVRVNPRSGRVPRTAKK